MTRDDFALVREFVPGQMIQVGSSCPADVTRNDAGTQLILTVRPTGSSRTLRVIATVTRAVEL